MSNLGKFSTLALLVIGAWVAVNWSAVKAAYRYRSQLAALGETAESLQSLGVLK